MTRSATAHSPIPPPSAAPWTRAMTGTGQVSIVSNMSAMAIASCSLPSTSSAIAARIQSMSAPAQNDGPSPARTTARSSVGASRASAANVVRSSAMSVASNALWTSGRARVTRATAPSGPGPLDAEQAAHRPRRRAGRRPHRRGRRAADAAARMDRGGSAGGARSSACRTRSGLSAETDPTSAVAMTFVQPSSAAATARWAIRARWMPRPRASGRTVPGPEPAPPAGGS